jgi:hypothetical protein
MNKLAHGWVLAAAVSLGALVGCGGTAVQVDDSTSITEQPVQYCDYDYPCSNPNHICVGIEIAGSGGCYPACDFSRYPTTGCGIAGSSSCDGVYCSGSCY